MTVSVSVSNVVSRLEELAEKAPGRPAVIVGESRVSFRSLNEDCGRIASGLGKIGLRRGARAALMVPPGPDFFALTFALFKIGAVPVLVDPGIGVQNLGSCLAEAEPEAFIGTPKAQLVRALGRWAKGSLRLNVTVGRPWLGGHSLEDIRRLGEARSSASLTARSDETAAVLFTSGSTGAPKGAVYTHAIFSAQIALLQEMFGVEPGEVSVATFPLFGLFDVALGMTAVIPRMDAAKPGSVDPREIIGPIQNHGAAQLFGSPALLERVARYGEAHKIHLPTLKRVISAGAPVPAKLLERFSRLLSRQARIYTPYGATEALPVCSIESREILGETASLTAGGRGVCVGRPVPGVEISIIKISDQAIGSWSEDLVLPDGEIGEIAVRGPVVTRRYHNRPEAEALAKISGPDGEIRHRMGDLGYRDGDGRIWFCGRKSHRVRTPSGVLYTIPCEAVFNRHPKARRTALVGVGEPGSQIPVLCVELEKGASGRKAVKAELLALGAAHPHTLGIKTILFHPRFPVDVRHNAKIFREKLALWATRKIG